MTTLRDALEATGAALALSAALALAAPPGQSQEEGPRYLAATCETDGEYSADLLYNAAAGETVVIVAGGIAEVFDGPPRSWIAAQDIEGLECWSRIDLPRYTLGEVVL